VNPSSSSPAPRLARQATAREFLAVLFRRKWIILGLFVVTTVTVFAVAFTTPKTWISSGRVMVKRGERYSSLHADRQVFSDWEQDLGTQMQVMKSQPVIKRSRELVAELARQEHQQVTFDPGKIDLEVVGKSNVIAMGYTDLEPVAAQIACKALMQAYLEYHKDRLNSDRSKPFFTQEISDINARIDKLMEERRSITEQSGMASPQAQTQSWLTQVSQLEARRGEMAADLASARMTEENMRKLLDDPEVDLPTFDGVAVFTNEGALVTLKQRVVEQEARIALLTETLRDDAQEVMAARQTLETLKGMLKKEVAQRVRLAGARTQSIQARVNVMDEELATLRQQLDAAPQTIKSVEALDAEVMSMRTRLRDVMQKQDDAAITENTVADVNVVVLSPASIAMQTNPLDFVRLGLAPAFSLLVGIAIAFFIDGLDLTVRTANQAEEYLDLPVLASMGERRRRNN